ncbi:Trp biosynthesis-associated membrane protein [Brachybacterium sp. AOP43-C2-M15]|uniref:Trp biosynthesis-associated membrane protein n=1 Tax=Brachybacterium sp. AOP43-C2-M15 TaxID=3457661 RepID=UPI00403403AC
MSAQSASSSRSAPDRRMPGRRTTVLAATAASALLAGATRTTWIEASAPDLTGSAQQIGVLGSEAAPAVLALSLVALAAALTTSLSTFWVRFLTGPVLVLAGAGSLLAIADALADPEAAARSSVTSATGVLGAAVEAGTTPWPLLALVPALAVAATGALVLWAGRSWPVRTRYRSAAVAAPAAAADPAQDPAAAWDALTRGEDPSLAAPEPEQPDAPASDGRAPGSDGGAPAPDGRSPDGGAASGR